MPNIETGLKMDDFEKTIKDYVKIRTMEHYKWKMLQNSIKYAGK